MSTAIQVSRSDIIGLCRLCLAKDLAEIDIFETGSEYRQLFTKIVTCLPVEVTQNEDLPTRICEVCNSKVDNFYQFWTSTAKNQKQLQEWLKTATDEIKKTDITTIKVEADDPRGEDYEPEDYDDDHRGDSYDEEEDAPSAPKRIKIQHSSDIEEDTKPSKLVLDSASNGASTSKTKKSTKETFCPDQVLVKEEWDELRRTKTTTCPKCFKQLADHRGLIRHVNEVHAKGKTFQCEVCNKCFVSNTRLNMHRKASHLGQKPTKLDLECYDCGKVYHNKVHLRDHMHSHLGIRPFKCEFCVQDFSSSKNLKRHLLVHKKAESRSVAKANMNPNIENFTMEEWMQLIRDKVTVCPKCNKEFANPKYMRKHMRDIHSSIKENICDQCGNCYKTASSLREHRKHMHSDKRFEKKKQKFTCQLCGLESATKYTLRDHMNTHTGEKHMCDICGRAYASVKHLKRHKIKHLKAEGMLPEEMIHRCEICGREFTQNCELKKHLEWVHGDKYHLCKVCGAKIKGSLKQHMITHTGEKKYCCHICGKHLRGKLKEHMLTHSNERPFACSICGSTFKDKWYLRIHMRKHNGERPYVCNVCGQTFAARSAYTLHAKKHDGPQTFECEYCDQVAPSKHLLKIHLKEHFAALSTT